MAAFPSSSRAPLGTTILRRPTTLSARAAERLSAGPLDAVTLMRDVCQVARLQPDAADRMAAALLASHDEFVQLPSGHWALREYPPSPINDSDPLIRRPNASTAEAGDSVAASSATGFGGLGLLAVDFAVVDVETTGTRTADRITEIAIACVRGGEIVEVYSQLVNPQRPIPAHISALTQITWSMVKDQPEFRHITDQVSQRLAGHVFTAHNAAFDWRFVNNEMARGGMRLGGPRLCTVRLARLLLPRLSRRSLDHVARYFGIEITSRHRAAGDAEATARALVRMLRIADGEGLNSWPLLEAQLSTPALRRRRSAAERRRRAFPLPVSEDHSA